MILHSEETSRPFIKRALELGITFAVYVQLTPDEIRHLEEAYQPHAVLGYA
jgi:hypothetical protein